MQLQNIECQLAKGQLNRYLGGDALSDTALTQLEDHLKECPECSDYLDYRKQALNDLLRPADPRPTPEDAPADSNPGASGAGTVSKFLVEAIRKKSGELDRALRPIPTHAVVEDRRDAGQPPKAMAKPLLYSIGLAAVLVGMSTLMRDPTRLFGERAATSLAANESSAKPLPATDEHGQRAAALAKPGSENAKSAQPSIGDGTNTIVSAQAGRPAASPIRRSIPNSTTVRRPSAPAARPRPERRPAASTAPNQGVRVYGA